MILELIFMIDNLIFELGWSNSAKSVKMRSKQQAYYSRGAEYVKPGTFP